LISNTFKNLLQIFEDPRVKELSKADTSL